MKINALRTLTPLRTLSAVLTLTLFGSGCGAGSITLENVDGMDSKVGSATIAHPVEVGTDGSLPGYDVLAFSSHPSLADELDTLYQTHLAFTDAVLAQDCDAIPGAAEAAAEAFREVAVDGGFLGLLAVAPAEMDGNFCANGEMAIASGVYDSNAECAGMAYLELFQFHGSPYQAIADAYDPTTCAEGSGGLQELAVENVTHWSGHLGPVTLEVEGDSGTAELAGAGLSIQTEYSPDFGKEAGAIDAKFKFKGVTEIAVTY